LAHKGCQDTHTHTHTHTHTYIYIYIYIYIYEHNGALEEGFMERHCNGKP